MCPFGSECGTLRAAHGPRGIGASSVRRRPWAALHSFDVEMGSEAPERPMSCLQLMAAGVHSPARHLRVGGQFPRARRLVRELSLKAQAARVGDVPRRVSRITVDHRRRAVRECGGSPERLGTERRRGFDELLGTRRRRERTYPPVTVWPNRAIWSGRVSQCSSGPA